MSVITYPHIEIDPRGRAWIPQANTKVIELVLEHIAYGWGGNELHRQHPHLTLGQIHSALAYYYDHLDEMTAAIEEYEQTSQQIRAQSADNPGQRKLQEIKHGPPEQSS